MKPELSIVKIGGNVIEAPDALSRFLSNFNGLPHPKILVHGGGKKATEVGRKLGVETRIFKGRRITDIESLEVTLMVYAGLVNKKIVGELQGIGCNAIGLSGADANLIQANKRPVGEVDFGWVGDICGVNSQALVKLISADLVPVFCAITHDQKGQMFNTNADTIASELAIGLGTAYSVSLFYCFEKQGVLSDKHNEESVIPEINWHVYRELIAKNIISDGMLPKLENSFRALEQGVSKVCIGNMDMIRSTPGRFTTLTL